MKKSRAIIHRSGDGQFYYTVVAKNGEVLVTSETFTQKHNAKGGIGALIWTCLKLWIGLKFGLVEIEDKSGPQK
jgi:uncharacterized protein YegP (UPF0339 family)